MRIIEIAFCTHAQSPGNARPCSACSDNRAAQSRLQKAGMETNGVYFYVLRIDTLASANVFVAAVDLNVCSLNLSPNVFKKFLKI